MSYTTIQHAVRIKLEISPNEYMILDMVYRMATSPKARIPGWCYSSKNYISKIIGIHESNVFRTINRLIEKGLLIRGKENALLRTSDKWNDLQMNPEDHTGVLPDHTRDSQKHTRVLQEEGIAFRNETYGVLPYNKYIDNYINDNNIDNTKIKDFMREFFGLLNNDLGLDDVIELLKDRKKKKEKSSAKKEKVFSTQVEYVYAQAIEHFTDYLRPKTKSAENDWKDEIRKLHELDERPFTEILEVIKWVRNDQFWSSNCLTMLKPRKKDKSGVMYYNVFLTKMKSESGKTSQENKQQQRIMDLAEKVRQGAEMAKQKLI